MSSTSQKRGILLPNSVIKAPGCLLKDKRDPFKVKTVQKRIQVLLEEFSKAQSGSTNNSPASTPKNSASAYSFSYPLIAGNLKEVGEDESFLSNFFKSYVTTDEIRCPGKLKTLSEEMSIIIHKATEILELYGIELVIEECKNSKALKNFLKTLIPEICFFPCDFYEKMNIKRLIISSKENCRESKENISFVPEIMDTEEQARKKFYKLVCDRLRICHPEITKQWEEKESALDFLQQDSYPKKKFEEVFVAMMNQTNHPLIKPEIKKLRELLANHYPETMAEQRFRNHSKEKKRGFRVHFDVNID